MIFIIPRKTFTQIDHEYRYQKAFYFYFYLKYLVFNLRNYSYLFFKIAVPLLNIYY